ncbi:MAG: hypothetical protein ACHQF0_11725 [Chitinophagales bacterium]
MKTNGLRSFIYKSILLILLSLYFLLVFSRTNNSSSLQAYHNGNTFFKPAVGRVDTPLPKLLSFEGTSSNRQVKLNWKFETTAGLDECILERADKSGDFKPVVYFFMTEDIHIPDLRYTDKVPKSKTYHYRLKLTGKDGDQQYTKTLTFNFINKQDQKRSLNYPLVMQ